MTYPSVTQILAPFSDFSRVPAERLRIAADRGSRVHAICAAIVQGLWVPSISDDCVGYVESFRKWLEIAKPEIVLSEAELIHPALGFIGHPDLICRLRGDDWLTVVDFKTPIARQATWELQLAAYLGLADCSGHDVRRSVSLRLKPDGGFPILDEYRDHARAWAAFLGALSAHNYLNGEK